MRNNIAYIAGAILGDGTIRWKRFKNRRKLVISLESKDRDLVEKVAKLSAELVGRNTSYSIIKRRRDGQFITEIYNQKLLKLYKMFLKNLPHISRHHKIEFLRGLFDTEGSPGIIIGSEGMRIRPCIGNTQLTLLKLAQKLLGDLGIICKIYSPPRSYYKDGRKRRKYYYLVIYQKNSLRKFARLIGFTISRKRGKFFIAYNLLNKYGSKVAADKWREHYVKRKNRWVKREEVLKV